jgi:hypothetical protein
MIKTAIAVGSTAALLAVWGVTSPRAEIRFGIVNPTPVPVSDAVTLGSSLQRYDLKWQGEASFTGQLVLAPNTQPVVVVAGLARYVPRDQAQRDRYCGFIRSILVRYPRVRDVIIWNEPKRGSPSSWWPADLDFSYYGLMLRSCAPVIHAFGARMIGPGMHPASPVTSQLPLVWAVAAAGPHLLDVWDIHGYWTNVRAATKMVRETLGWRIPIWVTEDGAQSRPDPNFASLYYGTPDTMWDGGLDESTHASAVATAMKKAYCAGASVWLNFLLTDERNLARWQTGLQRPDGSRKPAYAAYAATAHAIKAGRVSCTTPPPPPPPPPPPAPPPKVRPPSPANCIVPKLVRLRLRAARRALIRAHCSLGRVRRVRSAHVRRGLVLAQRPRPRTHLAAGTRVRVVLSRGRR